MFFFSENEYFLPCSLFHYSYSKQSIQFVARSETNLLAITASQGKRRKIKSIFPYFNQGEYSKYRKLKKIHLVYLNFVYLLICNASFQISVNFDIHLAFMCVMDHYFDVFFLFLFVYFSVILFSVCFVAFAYCSKNQYKFFDDRKCINYFIGIEAEILITFLSIQGRGVIFIIVFINWSQLHHLRVLASNLVCVKMPRHRF